MWTAYHWIRAWSAPSHQTMWIELQTIATIFAFGAAVGYVVLTHRLWKEAASQRESLLMLRIINGYDKLRDDIQFLQDYYRDCAMSGPSDPIVRFRDEITNPDFTADEQARSIDDPRFRVSRFFVRIRKLARAGYLSDNVVRAALDRDAVDVFLKLVDPLDEAKSGRRYKHDDRDFFENLRKGYPAQDDEKG